MQHPASRDSPSRPCASRRPSSSRSALPKPLRTPAMTIGVARAQAFVGLHRRRSEARPGLSARAARLRAPMDREDRIGLARGSAATTRPPRTEPIVFRHRAWSGSRPAETDGQHACGNTPIPHTHTWPLTLSTGRSARPAGVITHGAATRPCDRSAVYSAASSPPPQSCRRGVTRDWRIAATCGYAIGGRRAAQ